MSNFVENLQEAESVYLWKFVMELEKKYNRPGVSKRCLNIFGKSTEKKSMKAIFESLGWPQSSGDNGNVHADMVEFLQRTSPGAKDYRA